MTDILNKFKIPPGPIMGITLIGILLLSSLLYYRAVKIQRFLEPALALSEPRIKFNNDINSLIRKEFGENPKGILFRSGSLYVDPTLLFSSSHKEEGPSKAILQKLGRIFLTALSDPDIRSRISLILVSTHLPITSDPNLNKVLRFQIQESTTFILNALYTAEPSLEKEYSTFFAVTAIPKLIPLNEPNWIEFQMIPTERLHIDVLERLEKYAH